MKRMIDTTSSREYGWIDEESAFKLDEELTPGVYIYTIHYGDNQFSISSIINIAARGGQSSIMIDYNSDQYFALNFTVGDGKTSVEVYTVEGEVNLEGCSLGLQKLF